MNRNEIALQLLLVSMKIVMEKGLKIQEIQVIDGAFQIADMFIERSKS